MGPSIQDAALSIAIGVRVCLSVCIAVTYIATANDSTIAVNIMVSESMERKHKAPMHGMLKIDGCARDLKTKTSGQNNLI